MEASIPGHDHSSKLQRQLGRQFHRRSAPSPTPLTPQGLILNAPVPGFRWVGCCSAWQACCCLPRWSGGASVGRLRSCCSAMLLLLQDALAAAAVPAPMPAGLAASDPVAPLPLRRMLEWPCGWSPLPCCFISSEQRASTWLRCVCGDATARRGELNLHIQRRPKMTHPVHLLIRQPKFAGTKRFQRAPAQFRLPWPGDLA